MFSFGSISKKGGIIFLIFTLCWAFPLSFIKAQSTNIPFGGIIALPPIPCTCTFPLGYFLIPIIPIGTPPSPPAVMYLPGVSLLYSFGNWFTPSTYLLGTQGPPVPCLVWYVFFCAPPPPPYPPIGTHVIMMGTSQ